MVEQLPVKELVAGSSPARGAKKITRFYAGYFCTLGCTIEPIFDKMSL